MGQNVVIGGSNSRLIQRGLARLDWLVVRDTDMIESANFWAKGHLVRDSEMRPEDIGTEVFLMPAELAGEKEGTFTNTHRLVQWHDKVIDGPGDSRSEAWFMFRLARRLKALYADSQERRDEPIRHLTLDYPVINDRGDIDVEEVLREISGYTWPDRKQLGDFKELEADGLDRLRLLALLRRPPRGRTSTRPAAATPTGRTVRGRTSTGPSPGPPTAGCSTTAPRPTPRASRGRRVAIS